MGGWIGLLRGRPWFLRLAGLLERFVGGGFRTLGLGGMGRRVPSLWVWGRIVGLGGVIKRRPAWRLSGYRRSWLVAGSRGAHIVVYGVQECMQVIW